jgi:hypothetical protein
MTTGAGGCRGGGCRQLDARLDAESDAATVHPGVRHCVQHCGCIALRKS